MNNLLNYNYQRGSWKHKHPPPTSLKFADCRGGFVKYHPPPKSCSCTDTKPIKPSLSKCSQFHIIEKIDPFKSRNCQNVWTYDFRGVTYCQDPPPSKNTWANKTIYEKHRFRNRQAAENAAPRSGPETIRYCGSSWPLQYSCWPDRAR